MEEEIEDVIEGRERLGTSELEYGNLVFIKRERPVYPNTKTKGPYIFIGYGDPDKKKVYS